jgi:rhodanese-related sulfurtransferase
MRLGRKDFDELMREPLVQWVTLDQARALAQKGAGLIDVRTEDEFRNGTVKGSINMPLYLLRRKARELDSKRHYVVFCQTGSRSCAAAFLLSQRGFEVSVLRGGLGGLSRAA